MSIKRNWHYFWLSYYGLLLKDCIDLEMKRKILKKNNYHKERLAAIRCIQHKVVKSYLLIIDRQD